MPTPPNNDEEWEESSGNFDLENVRPFLQRVSSLIESGFGEAQIQQVCQLAERMEAEADEELEFPIRYAGEVSVLRVGIFMDDVDAPDVYFFSTPALAEQIDTEMEAFFEELGM